MTKQHWMEIVPIDCYLVHSSSILHDFDRTVLTNLYQPLVGNGAFSLYMTLWGELEKQKMWGNETTHHMLMVTMDISLRKIYEYRLKLEAIGLLKTYVSVDEDNVRHFVYEICPPRSPKAFFDDMIMAVFLYHRLGKTKYNQLRSAFLSPKFDTSRYQEVTASFHDVFESLPPSEMKEVAQIEEQEEQIFHTRKEQDQMQFSSDLFNFDLFYEGLNDAIIPKRAINKKIKEAIIRLAFLYGADHIQMKNAVMGALTADDKVDEELLRKTVREWYQFQHGNQLPALVERTQPQQYQTMQSKEPTTQEETHIQLLERVSPRQLLIDMSGGAEPSSGDLKIVEDVMFNQKLPAGVVNVLIQYVMIKTDMKLTKGYIEKIASHWARKKVKTVKEAMDLAKEENRQYQEWATSKNSPKRTTSKKATRTEMVPEWLNKKEEQPTEETEEIKQMRKDLEERLKKYQ